MMWSVWELGGIGQDAEKRVIGGRWGCVVTLQGTESRDERGTDYLRSDTRAYLARSPTRMNRDEGKKQKEALLVTEGKQEHMCSHILGVGDTQQRCGLVGIDGELATLHDQVAERDDLLALLSDAALGVLAGLLGRNHLVQVLG
jgi:hypothetical protein